MEHKEETKEIILQLEELLEFYREMQAQINLIVKTKVSHFGTKTREMDDTPLAFISEVPLILILMMRNFVHSLFYVDSWSYVLAMSSFCLVEVILVLRLCL